MNIFQVNIRNTSQSPAGKIYRYSILVLILIGLIFRMRIFLTGRSLWLDEAMLALNIIQRSFGGLLQQPMEYGQSAPIGYVFSVKVFTLLLGDSEYALRFYSLLAGCFALLLAVFFFKSYLDRVGVLVAVALFAGGPHLIYYTAETKQYAGDVIVSLMFLMIFFSLLDKQATLKSFLILGGVGAILLWFSHPAVFVAAGVGLTLLLNYWLNKDSEKLTWTILCGAIWGISLVILYFVNLRHLAASELLLDYWQEGFMPFPPWQNINWFAQLWQAWLHDPLGIEANPVVVFFIFITGIIFLFRRDWRLGTAIFLSLIFALLASGLDKYSLVGRLLLYTTPIFIIAMGAGIDALGSLISNRTLSFGIQTVVALYLLSAPFQASFDEFLNPKYREHIKPFMEYLSDHRKAGELIYIYHNTGPAFRFYAPKYGLELDNTRIGTDQSTDPQAYYTEIDSLKGNKRVWFIFSHVYEKNNFNEKDFMLDYIDRTGKRVREYRVPETSVYLYLYDLR